MAEVLESTRLPCGCVISRVLTEANERQLHIRPCSLTCEYYAFTLEESQKRGNRTEVR